MAHVVVKCSWWLLLLFPTAIGSRCPTHVLVGGEGEARLKTNISLSLSLSLSVRLSVFLSVYFLDSFSFILLGYIIAAGVGGKYAARLRALGYSCRLCI